MKRVFAMMTVLALAMFLTTSSVSGQGKKDKDFTIKAFMKKYHGKAGDRSKLQAAIKEKDWDTATKISKEYLAGALLLAKATPKKGEKDDFAKLANGFCKATKALHDACEAKDDKKASAALKSSQGYCGLCHKAHK
jgi:hypothetical protein